MIIGDHFGNFIINLKLLMLIAVSLKRNQVDIKINGLFPISLIFYRLFTNQPENYQADSQIEKLIINFRHIYQHMKESWFSGMGV